MGLVVRSLAAVLDRPERPPRLTVRGTLPPVLRWWGQRQVRAIKALVARHPYELVVEAAGSPRHLVETGAVSAEQLGQPLDRRAWCYYLRFELRDGPAQGVAPPTGALPPLA